MGSAEIPSFGSNGDPVLSDEEIKEIVEVAGTMDEVHERHGTRPATEQDIERLADELDPYMPPEGEGRVG